MNISKYKAFLTVAEMGSISKAAKYLKYSQPGISHMLSSLEEELGFTVLKRINGSYVLTENGKQIISYCQQIVKNEENLKSAVSSINGLLTGSISIASYNSMLLDYIPNAVADFCKVYPNIQISLYECDHNVMIDGLTNNMFDLAFICELVPKGFQFIPLFHDPIGLILHKSHPFMSYDKIPVSILNGCNFIMHSSGARDVLDALIKKEPFNPVVTFTSNSDSAVMGLVSHNSGVSLLSSFHKSRIPEDTAFKEFERNFYRTLGMSIRSTDYASPAVKEFIRFVSQKAQSHELYYKNVNISGKESLNK
ncbi:MAG: LysR family transcriptional regulator [Firmicutes bacterium]|nr:LysR family transcriptional regulator [Bacillota bacterium]